MVTTSAGTRPGQILVVDDDAFQRRVLSDAVTEVGHEAITASGVDDAFNVLATRHVDVVLLDVIMPGVSDLSVLERMRGEHPRVEVIVCTGVNDVDTAVGALRAGASDYLVKPIVPAVLQRAVARAVDQRRLLGENQRLRRALDLVLAGQRIMGSVDMDRICEAGLDGMLAMTVSDVGVMGARDGVMVTRDMDARAAQQAMGAEGGGPSVMALPETQQVFPLYGPVLLLQMKEAGVRGMVARRKGQPDYASAELEAAEFLVKHAELALQNHSRFAAAADAARRDSLTGLLNARVLEEVVAQSIVRSRDEQKGFAVLFLDLDHFKLVNDSHGHLLGSRLLVEMAAVIQRAVRPKDLVFRYGGDEFSVMLEKTLEPDAMMVAERLRASVERHPFLVREGVRATVTMSVGVGVYPQHGTTARDIIASADAAMYEAKRSGKNRVAMGKRMTTENP